MRVSVIVPAHGAPGYLDTCLEAISKSSHDDFEVIVVDDGSATPLREIVDKYGYAYIRLRRNYGAATARNVGAGHAGGEVLLFIDSDVRVRPDTVLKVARAFENPRVHVYQGLASKTPLNKGFGPQLMALRWFFLLKDIPEASFVYSHVFSIRKSLFEETGGFNESFKPPGFGDEFEFGHRLRRKYTIHVDPELLVEHKFQGIMARARSVYHRAYTWATIFTRTRHFEKANASLKEAAIGAVDLLMLLTVPLFLVHPWLASVPAVLLLVQTALNARFYAFLRSEMGTGFALRSVIPGILWSVAQTMGGMAFLCKRFLGIDQIARGNVFQTLRFRASKSPSHLVLFVTARCNGRCRHCFYWRETAQVGGKTPSDGQEMSLAEFRDVSRKMGHVEMLTITGGEPSLRSDLPQIIGAFYRNNSTRHVTIHTNGFLEGQVTRMLTSMLRSCPLMEFNVSLSVDGLNGIHDGLRGVEGAFEKVRATLKALERMKLRFNNLNITVNTVFNRANQEDVVPLIDYIYQHHDIDGYYLALVRGETMDPGLKDIDLSKYRSAIKHLERWKAKRGAYNNYLLAGLRNAVDDLAPADVVKAIIARKNAYQCKAGQTVVVISERGDVSPCEMLGLSFGNLRDFDHDVGRVLGTRRARQIVKAIKGGSCTCTWECAVMNNLVFSWWALPRVLVKWLRNFKRGGT